MASWLKALLFVTGGVAAAAGTAYFTRLFDSPMQNDPTAIAALPDTPVPQQVLEDESGAPPAASTAAPEPARLLPEPAKSDDSEEYLALPGFDILRVEPDGSLLIAGHAEPESTVEVLHGATVLITTQTSTEGDFVAILSDPLKPGDYQISLRVKLGNHIAVSPGTAVISIPKTPDGQVLALVDIPDKPTELITVPKGVTATETKNEAAKIEQSSHAGENSNIEAGIEPDVAIAISPEEQEHAMEHEAIPAGQVIVDAVELEGDSVFVAGQAVPGRIVRVYVDAAILGEAHISPSGRFLVEAERRLAVGNYLVRADLLEADGSVVARAAVPFRREPGEAIAAVAPSHPSAKSPVPSQAHMPDTGKAEVKVEYTSAPALQQADGAVIIRRGDSLWNISRRVYGHGVRYSTIYLANREQIQNPDKIWPGQIFTLPHETPEGEQADLKVISDRVTKPGGKSASQ